ncbi:MAG TPA: 6,7-dimethyl-8-ribityllumazine synthase [bacterium]|nr:6,7-dimethyl-8-ribityllumazine synthase [bacterium]
MGASLEGGRTGAGLRIGVAVSRFNARITRRMLTGALAALQRSGVAEDAVDVAWAPGAYDLPVVAQALARSGRYDALVCLGCVIRGETTHDRYVALGAATGLVQVSLETALPIAFGVLTTHTLEQAEARSGGTHGNKGEDAALAAVELANVLRMIRTPPGG